jgi:hypothetical protein
MDNSQHIASIHVLDDDSLLGVFYLYRPVIFDGDEDDVVRIEGGRGWDRERWWYRLAHVCQRWRNLILGSASYLGLGLVCTYGTPVADMLAHSPPLPLIIDYDGENRDITADDEEGIILALKLRDRVRRVRLAMSVPSLQMLVMAIDEEYPVLEYLIIGPSTEDDDTALMLPETLLAPHLRHLLLSGFSIPTGLLTTAVGIVTLCLSMDLPPTYFQPNTLLQWISSMPQLETLVINFSFPFPDNDVPRQPMHSPIITLPNLHWFEFRGVSAYMEAIVCRIAAPRLEKLGIMFFEQPTLSVSHLLQFMNTTKNLMFDRAKFEFFRDEVCVEVYPPDEDEMYAFSMNIQCSHLDRQVASVAQIFSSLSQMFSTVESLTLIRKGYLWLSEGDSEVNRTQWRKLIGSFRNVKTLSVADGLVKGLPRILHLDDGGQAVELLPGLQELEFFKSDMNWCR